MGDTLWQAHGAVLSWHVGPDRGDGRNRLRFTITHRTAAALGGERSAVTLDAEQWRALVEWLDGDTTLAGLDPPPGR